jgi:rare lipoprotein A
LASGWHHAPNHTSTEFSAPCATNRTFAASHRDAIPRAPLDCSINMENEMVSLPAAVAGVVAIVAIAPSPVSHQHSSSGGSSGVASVYSVDSGASTASGARLDPGAFTAAHRTLPFGTRVRVTNKNNGRSVVVTINDRGPFVQGRIIDLTPAAARAIGFSGLVPVTIQVE